MDTPSRVFCGRRKTDLTPTIPIKRDDYTVMSRSTSRGSGRVYSSMTRLDRSRSPGGSVTQHHGPTNSPQRPSRSKSTTHLQSAGLKLTRTEILRQALATKKERDGGELYLFWGGVSSYFSFGGVSLSVSLSLHFALTRGYRTFGHFVKLWSWCIMVVRTFVSRFSCWCWRVGIVVRIHGVGDSMYSC